jgi:lipopolysaccharide biosynthesis glycosyltransferase
MIELACTTDGGYAPHTGTMLHSVFAANPGTRFRVHVLCRTLAEPDRRGLREVAQRFGAQLDFLLVTPALSAPFPDRHFHPSCWFRVLLPELLPTIERVLYLDSDLIVRDKLAELWETDVSAHLFAGVVNPFYPFFPDYHVTHLGLQPGSPYYNSGVLLMNLARMRAVDFGGRIRAYAAEHPDNLYPEQDALNALYQHEARPLHPRWNAQSTIFELADAELPFTPQQVAEARAHPAVVHFIGPYKPWTYVCTHPLRHLYLEHRRHTPWPPGPLPDRTFRNFWFRLLPVQQRYRWNRFEAALRRRLRRLLRGAPVVEAP